MPPQVIEKWILPKTTTIIDCLKTYDKTEPQSIPVLTANNSLIFVDPMTQI